MTKATKAMAAVAMVVAALLAGSVSGYRVSQERPVMVQTVGSSK
jgi:hypothetical protein